MTPSTASDLGTTRGGFALLTALVVVASFMLPGGGLLVAFGRGLFGAPLSRRRTRILFIVAFGVLVLQASFLAFAMWSPTVVCSSFNGGPTTCETG